MKMNLSVPAQTLAGQPWKENGEVVMLNKVVANRLFVMDGKDKPVEKYELAIKLHNATGEVEITEAEKTLIKEASADLIVALAAQIQIIVNNAK